MFIGIVCALAVPGEITSVWALSSMKQMRTTLAAACWLTLCTTFHLCAEDWPQWQGPGRDGIWREEGIVRELPVGGPSISWRVEVGGGYAGPAVANGRVFVSDYLTTGDRTPNSDKRSRLL